MASIKKQCSNVPTATYSGKEQSPLRFGLSAEGYPLHTILEGNDKLLWKVEIKNNRKVWIRNLINDKITHEDPVINDEKTITTVQIETHASKDINTATSVIPKKTTDYNIFLSYRLKQLKNENKDKDYENKTLFNKVMDEWKQLKTSPSELKCIIEKIKIEDENADNTKTEKKLSAKQKKVKVNKKSDEVLPEKSDEVLPEKSDEVLPEKSEEVLPEKSDEVLSVKSDEVLQEKSDEVLPEKIKKVSKKSSKTVNSNSEPKSSKQKTKKEKGI